MINIIDDFAQTTNNRLAANNVGFYFDYQNGEYGFNTSETRGADTFSPFRSGGSGLILVGNVKGQNKTLNVTSVLDNYADLTKNNFLIGTSSAESGRGLCYYGYANASFNAGQLNSYNASTGILNVTSQQITLSYPGIDGSSTLKSVSQYASNPIYCAY